MSKPYLCVYAYTCTDLTKVISLSEEAYRILKANKQRNESFSDVILRVTKPAEARPLSEFAAQWNGSDIDQVFAKVRHERETAQPREPQL